VSAHDDKAMTRRDTRIATTVRRGDPDVLAGEFTAAQATVDRLTVELRAATVERNAVLAALAETGMTFREMSQRTGMAPWRIRTALWNDYRERCT
jgi:hypothetical protein